MNLKIKYREGFRPFSPVTLESRVSDYFELDRQSPYMLLVAPVKQDRRTEEPDNLNDKDIFSKNHFQYIVKKPKETIILSSLGNQILLKNRETCLIDFIGMAREICLTGFIILPERFA